MRKAAFLLLLAGCALALVKGEDARPLAKGVRGLVTRAPGAVAIDGKLEKAEWAGAFCTPVHYGHARLEERAASSSTSGTRRPSTSACGPSTGIGRTWGTANALVERRRGRVLPRHEGRRGPPRQGLDGGRDPLLLLAVRGSRGPAALGDARGDRDERHEARAGSRWPRRSTHGATRSSSSCPGPTSPGSSRRLGAVMALDAELCSGDGGARTDRTFAYGSPLSVQQPASLGKVELVESRRPGLPPDRRPGGVPDVGRDAVGPGRSGRRSSRSSRSRRLGRDRRGGRRPDPRRRRQGREDLPAGSRRSARTAGLCPRRGAVVDRRVTRRAPISPRRSVEPRQGKPLTTVRPGWSRSADVGEMRGPARLLRGRRGDDIGKGLPRSLFRPPVSRIAPGLPRGMPR